MRPGAERLGGRWSVTIGRRSSHARAVSGRLTSEKRTQDRYIIRAYLSTAVKHGRNALTVLRQAITGEPWLPPYPAPT